MTCCYLYNPRTATHTCRQCLEEKAFWLHCVYVWWFLNVLCLGMCSWNVLFDVCLLFIFAVALRPNAGHGSSFLRFLDHSQRRTTVGRTPLDERSARRTDLYLTTHNTHNRQTSMPAVGLETTISADERPQIYALDRAATGSSHWRTESCVPCVQ